MKIYFRYLIGAFLFISIISLFSSVFIIREGRQAIITQFGKPVGDAITTTGVHFKVPFIQEARFVDKRILSWDGYPNQIPTKDKKYIWVDTTARFRITDALKFIQTVQNERGAKARLDAVLDAATRDVISNHRLVEAVRNTNQILDRIKLAKENPKNEIEEEITGEIEPIKVGRERLSDMIVESADSKLSQFGIQLVGLQLRRIAYERSVEQKVYERMISERKRIAEKIRSVGKGEQAKIQGKVSQDLQEIESNAYRQAQLVKGKADAEATAIYARALSRDPQFYEFIRKMEAYRKAIKPESELILSTDADFLDLLRKP